MSVQERMLNLACCTADAAAEGASVIDPDRALTITVSVQTGDGKTVAESVRFSDDYHRRELEPVASRRAPEPPLPVVDEYAPAVSHETLYELADTLVKERKERVL